MIRDALSYVGLLPLGFGVVGGLIDAWSKMFWMLVPLTCLAAAIAFLMPNDGGVDLPMGVKLTMFAIILSSILTTYVATRLLAWRVSKARGLRIKGTPPEMTSKP